MIDIIIPVVDLLDDTKACIESVSNNSEDEEYRLIIINNGSGKETSDYLHSGYLYHSFDAFVIDNGKNLGFVKATNQGLKRSENDVVLLNNDVTVPEGWLKKLKEVAYSDDSIGLVGPLCKSSGGHDSYQEVDRINVQADDSYVFIDSLAFFCTYIKKKVIDEVGLLDENFGRGQSEDRDYCIRAIKKGYKLAIATDVVVKHKTSKTYALLGIDRLQDYYENRGYLLKKHREYFNKK